MQKILCCSSVYAMSEASINTNELTSSRCKTIRVTERISICAFVRNNENEFSHGRVFYQLHRPETIQFRHLIVVRKKSNGLFVHVTEDEEIRQLLGIPVGPDHEETAEYDVDETILNSYDIFIQSTSINTDLLPDTGEGDNAASTADGVLNDLERKREKVAECLAKAVVRENRVTETRIKYELTASMLKRFEDVKMSWQSYTNHVDIVDITDLRTTGITINTPDITLREIFKHLQWFVELYRDAGNLQYIPCKLPIGGSDIVFYLSRSTDNAVDQILVYTKDSDWPGSTTRSHYDSGYWAPTYNTMVEVLNGFSDQLNLAQVMIRACQSNLNNQPNFSESLRIPGNAEKTANMTRQTVEFLVVTMVAEAATPADSTRAKFIELMATTIDGTGCFPEQSAMPKLGDLGPGLKTGRSPTADDIALDLLYLMRDEDIRIDVAFSDNNYPIRQQGGTQLGREYLHNKGDNIIHIPSFLSVLKAGHGQTD